MIDAIILEKNSNISTNRVHVYRHDISGDMEAIPVKIGLWVERQLVWELRAWQTSVHWQCREEGKS